MVGYRKQTVEEFLKHTRNKYIISVSEGNNDNIVFEDTYGELKKNRKDLLKEVVLSWDVVRMADNTLVIGIMI